jgi:hypothetical protein
MAAAVLFPAGPASADVYPGSDFIKDWQTGRCLDSNDRGFNSGDVYTNPCQLGNPYQQWHRIYLGTAYAPNGRAYDVVAFQDVATGYCNGGNYQNWHWGY